jgi:uncharacterized protein (TIGR02117 family)
MARFIRRFGYAVAVIVLLLAAGTFVPRPFFSASPDGDMPRRRILVLTNPIHTDIAIPFDDEAVVRFAPLLKKAGWADIVGAQYLVFGWGSRAFYIETPTWSELKLGPLLTALTLDDSVVHVSLTGAMDETRADTRGFDVTEAEFGRLLAFLDGSFRVGIDGPIMIAGAGYGEYDRFFDAHGRFTALLGCNTWAAAGLRAAGLRTGWWNPIPQTLGISLDAFN